jgi:hypothetical protein
MPEMIKRDPIAHLKSLEMDPDRKLLIVEGKEDRLFVEYLCGQDIDSDLVILEIQSVEIDAQVEGGNRGRILYFAGLTDPQTERIKFFIDRDYSSYLGLDVPVNITQTDYKDLETYLLNADCLDKLIKIGIKTDRIDSNKFFNEAKKASYFGFVRISSLKSGLNLSVNETNENIRRYINVSNTFDVSINDTRYLTALLQNSNNRTSISDLKTIINSNIEDLKDEELEFIIHGKDLLSLVTEICFKLGSDRENIDNLFWMSFDKTKIEEYKNLNEIVVYSKKNLP